MTRRLQGGQVFFNNTMFKELFVLLLLYVCLNSFAQSDFRPGYIVTMKGDTVQGLINYSSDVSNGNVCQFKKGIKATSVTYLPDQLLSYRFIENKLYRSKKIIRDSVEAPLFLECLIEGRASV